MNAPTIPTTSEDPLLTLLSRCVEYAVYMTGEGFTEAESILWSYHQDSGDETDWETLHQRIPEMIDKLRDDRLRLLRSALREADDDMELIRERIEHGEIRRAQETTMMGKESRKRALK